MDTRSGIIPLENTLACFEYALEHRCDGFEFDVRITRDGKLLLCHDASLRGRKVAASSFDMLCSGADETLPSLDDVLTAFHGRAYLDIEVKVAGAEELIVEALRRNTPERYLLSSFLPEVLLRFHQLDSSLPLGYVCRRSADVRRWQELPIAVFLPHHEVVDEKLVQEAHRRDVQVFTWTVNREQDMRRLAEWGIDGLISDGPILMTQTFLAPRALAKGQ
jgi:glycerophosphoryl diester phosphodiesterase